MSPNTNDRCPLEKRSGWFEGETMGARWSQVFQQAAGLRFAKDLPQLNLAVTDSRYVCSGKEYPSHTVA